MQKTSGSIVNAMTVDVEDYFQVSAFEKQISRNDWASHSSRVEENTDRILALFAIYNVKATFFTLGWLAERYPQMVQRIVEQGHEIASHGWDHRRATSQSKDEFRQDIVRAKAMLEDVSGQVVKGYRAPSYSICEENLWALDILADEGHLYSSSIVPIKHDHYGMPGASRFAFMAADGRLLEIPVTTIPIFNRNINCGGGGWFRLFPYAFTRWALNQVNNDEGMPCNFYFHPWEIDPQQPKIADISFKTRFRHYLNLDKMHGRLENVLQDFRWGRMDEIFLDESESRTVLTSFRK
ncbi:XrtA system polysaccharide deacetylase [Neptunomonas antarctica]|uniref:Polysaccharide deacetylase family protein, PEP-CTERM locus subfamily n=1 Tax=Neptunomonas antarctica TaxID=619304 RepID=A0A1N7JE73_9GAMM|nr:XrtA system polysaccharide deacetylase [Neptunomonas antarctica]SIS47599.1 polysaccharide deacetylase family protein, PEP-CTERM locus subfamily [Neptunomonas antarctica]